MKRECTKIRCSFDGKRAIYVDDANADVLIKYIGRDSRHQRKFKHICDIILEGLRNKELYDKEDINEKCKDVTAMKLFKGQENDRIYCKEITTTKGVHVVITCELLERKKSTKLTQREINIIEKVAKYEYKIDE